MFFEEIKKSLELLENKQRFFKIESEKNTYFYDSYIQGLYSIETRLLNDIFKNKNLEGEYFNNISLENHSKIMSFLSTVKKNNVDKVLPLEPDKKCSLMINTSNICNLNCAYCYRDKQNPSVTSLDTIKETIKFAMTEYKPEASEFVVSYSMTSESSKDLELLKQTADEYINFENYQFTEDDVCNELKEELFNRLKESVFPKVNGRIDVPDSKNEIVKFLNNLLEFRDLYEILNVTDRMFNDDAKWQIQQRKTCTKWRLYRINRWCLEVIFDKYLMKKHVPYVTFWFMTNGTCASKEYIDFVKACDINPLWISIDGPKEVHDYNRKFYNENGSYDEVINNIKVFKENNINLKASVVLTSFYPKPLEIVNHLMSLGIKEIAMTPVRPGYDCSFDEKSIEELCKGYDSLFNALEKVSLNKDFSLFRVLKEDMSLAAFNIFLGRTKLIKRCSLDDQIVVNSKGEIYPCLYFTDNKDFCLGNIKGNIDKQKYSKNILVNDRENCHECWARYLCGGTCFYGSYITRKNYLSIEPMECILKKHLAEKCLRLIVFFKEHNISFNGIYN